MTEQPKWTPGPWRVGSRGGSSSAVETADGRYILADLTEVDGEENARLIAAAPDLYADLFALVDYAKKKRIFRDDMGQGVEDHCNRVLAKARGEQS